MEEAHGDSLSRLVDQALALTPEERVLYLDACCGKDQALRAELERLIMHHHQASTFMQEPLMPIDPSIKNGDESRNDFAVLRAEDLGPYEILSRIASGGMASVFKARDRRLDRVVAIKVSKSPFSERFNREARLIAALNHPNICQVYDVGSNYLVLEYIDGEPLKGPLPLQVAVRVGIEILSALQEAHRQGIIHRDLEPGNILLAPSGVKVLDFGIARRDAGDGVKTESLVTKDGAVVGTPAYIAPEQWQGRPADAKRRCEQQS